MHYYGAPTLLQIAWTAPGGEASKAVEAAIPRRHCAARRYHLCRCV